MTAHPEHPSGEDLRLRIEGPAAGGAVIARVEGRVVFVSGALPGELVRARTVPGPGKVLRAEVTEVLEPSPHRVPDRRVGFLAEAADPSGRAVEEPAGDVLFGGMEYAHVDLAHSRELKARIITDQLERIGGIEREVSVAAAPGETTGMDWRTRVQLAVGPDGELGMLPARSHDVVAVSSAPLAVDAIAEVDLPSLRLRGADRVEFASAGESGAVIVRGVVEAAALEDFAARLPADWSLLAGPSAPARSAARRGHGRGGDRRGGRGRRDRVARRGGDEAQGLRVVRGQDSLLETVGGRDFRVAADGFWQVHRAAPGLLSSAVTAALPSDVRTITDLYCGVGLLGIGAAAATGATLFGVEGVGPAIEHARANAVGIEAEFAAGRVDAVPVPASDVVLLDPPRAGAGPAVTGRLTEEGPETIVYVSCDAGTLARDLAALTAGGYGIESLEGLDLFPLTAHVETVTVLRR